MGEEVIRDLFTYGITYFVGYLIGSLTMHLKEKTRKVEDEVSE